MNISQAHEISIISFLEKEGFRPCRIYGDNYWYRSPLREEKIASFKVNRDINWWYDYGMSEGGDIVELAKRLRGLPTVSATLEYLEGESGCAVRSAIPRASSSQAQPSHEQPTFTVHPLKNKSLLSYLRSRQIDESIGCTYCQEIHQKQKGRWYFSVAFGNQSGGYELRNPYFKGCMGSKDLSIIAYSPGEIQEGCLVFEGFMDFLSFLTLVKRQDYLFRMESPCDYLILNSVCNQKKVYQYLERYRHIHCFLDNDAAGKEAIESLHKLFEYRVTDESFRYADYKDINDYLMNKKTEQQDVAQKQ